MTDPKHIIGAEHYDADMCAAKGHVCFTPESGHVQCN
jgi:hypothetical protein